MHTYDLKQCSHTHLCIVVVAVLFCFINFRILKKGHGRQYTRYDELTNLVDIHTRSNAAYKHYWKKTFATNHNRKRSVWLSGM